MEVTEERGRGGKERTALAKDFTCEGEPSHVHLGEGLMERHFLGWGGCVLCVPCDCVAAEAVDIEALVAALGAGGCIPEVVGDAVGTLFYDSRGAAIISAAEESVVGTTDGEGSEGDQGEERG